MGKIRIKQTPNQRAWRQQARRINLTIRDLKESGFAFHEEAYVKYNPKRVTKKALNRIKSITSEQIINQAMLENPETGKYEYAHLDRATGEVKFRGTKLATLSTWDVLNDKRTYQEDIQGEQNYAYAYEIIIDNFIKYFENSLGVWDGGRGVEFINMIEEANGKYSAYEVAKALSDAESMVGLPRYESLKYESGIVQCKEYMRYFWNVLGASDDTIEKWNDAMDASEYWSDFDNEE